MHPTLAAFARTHGLTEDDLAELDTLIGSGFGVAASVLDAYQSVDLEPVGHEAVTEERPRVTERYQDLGPIGHGGMAEVRRVRDLELNRVLAMKIVRPELLRRPAALARFVEEAQATAQLQHPNIVPVHDLGVFRDGRVWFTMKEVRGRTLAEVIAEVHAVSVDRWEVASSGWRFRRLVAALHTVCHAVAYAHDRGVVHRDLKPANTMVGTHGEVYVLDWGLAKIVGRAEHHEVDLDPVRIDRAPEHATRAGQIAGTPAYMPPEQARGEVDAIDARSDVYALGAMLYEVLSGGPPYQGAPRAVLQQVTMGPPPSLGAGAGEVTFGFGDDPYGEEMPSAGPGLPADLIEICERAMSREPARRYLSATELADALGAWLDGARRREHALEWVERADQVDKAARRAAARARALRTRASALEAELAPWMPEERKAPVWAKVAEAEEAESGAQLLQLEVDQTLQAALQIQPDLEEAHERLALRHQARFAAAEEAREQQRQEQERTLLELHAAALPERHPTRIALGTFLDGDGTLDLVTDPPGAQVVLHRYRERNRRLVEGRGRVLGTTPLRAFGLPMGSYLCVIQHPGCDPVRYPVRIGRQGHWGAVAPGESEPRPIWLPPRGLLQEQEIYVPAGWFRAGGDPEAPDSFPAARMWCDALVFQRDPVTNAEYLAFLDARVAQGRVEEALRYAPRERASSEGGQGGLIYGFDGERFSLVPDADGDVWLPDWPVLQIDWASARAYLDWLSEGTGRPWRLPAELEWEKAARGVDGRFHPWGDRLDAAWCCIRDSHRDHPLPAVVGAHGVDVSPYGVRGLGGNVCDWCLGTYDAGSVEAGGVVTPTAAGAERALRTLRGGSWLTDARHARAANRYRNQPGARDSYVGFRGVWRPDG